MKIAIVGAGNGACVTAMYLHLIMRLWERIVTEIDIYYDSSIPIERVGQGCTHSVAHLIYLFGDLDMIENNPINSTPKWGTRFEGWGKREKIFNSFDNIGNAIHYSPDLLSKFVLNSGNFNVIDKNIIDPEKEIDADYIFDCRGRGDRDPKLYQKLNNPINSVILSNKKGRDPDLTFTRSVATPDGWTFVIPNSDSVSYGYLYNKDITSKEDAEKNFVDMFDVVPDGALNFENYIAKNAWVGERTIMNGNRLSFLEPLEATSTDFYQYVVTAFWHHAKDGIDKNLVNMGIKHRMSQIETFILWHYKCGSKYEGTPFWNYCKSLEFKPDSEFNRFLNDSRKTSNQQLQVMQAEEYAMWNRVTFKNWDQVNSEGGYVTCRTFIP